MSLSSLPEGPLLEILSQLDDSDLQNLCTLNKRINQLCLQDYLWQLRVNYFYPEYVDLKPNNLSWNQYYVAIKNKELKLLPMYEEGDFVGYSLVYIRDWSKTIHNIINQFTDPTILFFLENIDPIAIYTPKTGVVFKPGNLSNINQVLIISSPTTNKLDYIVNNLSNLQTLFNIIYEHIYSIHNQYPVYVEHRYDFYYLTVPTLNSTIQFNCHLAREIVFIPNLLGISAPLIDRNPYDRLQLLDLLKACCSKKINYDNLTDSQLNDAWQWYKSDISKEKLCQIILNRLYEIGHVH